MEAQGSPHRHSQKGEAEAVTHTAGAVGAPDVFIGGRAQHDSQGMQTGQQGPSLGLPQTHTRGDSFTKGLTNIREGQGGWEVGREGRGRGQRPRSKGHLASAIAHILWPPARKYSIATGLRSPEASPSQTPEPDGQTDPFPACLPAASLKTNRRRRQKNQKKKTNTSSVKDTGKVGGGVEEAAEKPLEVPPQLGRGVGGRTPIWGGVELVKQ